MSKYARLGASYYCVYNPEFWRRDKHNSFEVYRLVSGVYQLQAGEPVWMPEIGLGIGRAIGSYDRCDREWLYWYDEQGNRFPTIEEIAAEERLRAEQERQRAERLAEQLRAMGINPEEFE